MAKVVCKAKRRPICRLGFTGKSTGSNVKIIIVKACSKGVIYRIGDLPILGEFSLIGVGNLGDESMLLVKCLRFNLK